MIGETSERHTDNKDDRSTDTPNQLCISRLCTRTVWLIRLLGGGTNAGDRSVDVSRTRMVSASQHQAGSETQVCQGEVGARMTHPENSVATLDLVATRFGFWSMGRPTLQVVSHQCPSLPSKVLVSCEGDTVVDGTLMELRSSTMRETM